MRVERRSFTHRGLQHRAAPGCDIFQIVLSTGKGKGIKSDSKDFGLFSTQSPVVSRVLENMLRPDDSNRRLLCNDLGELQSSADDLAPTARHNLRDEPYLQSLRSSKVSRS